VAILRSYSATFEQTGLSSAAAARYRFNEGTGSDALEIIQGMDGTYQAGAAPGALGSIGDGAASFDGNDGLVLVDAAVTEPLQIANGAFEMWFTVDALGGQQTLFGKNAEGQGTGGHVEMFVRASGAVVFALGSETDNFLAESAPGTIEAGAPTHLVANFGADGMQVFLNGVAVASNDFTGGLQGNFEPLVMGARTGSSTSDTTQFLGGTIDELAVYDRPLTADEVGQLLAGGDVGTRLVGTAEADELIGGSDDEELRGAGGDDILLGNDGNDTLIGGGGADELRGGAGDDGLDGKGGRDLLTGGAGDDLFNGGTGVDKLRGGGGNDELLGNAGRDELRGDAGDDLLNGGRGADTLSGGSGSDTFRIDQIGHGVDQILDFSAGAGGDVLDLSDVIDVGAGDDVADFVRLQQANGDTEVAVDADGGGDSFSAVFNLVGATGLDLGSLVDDGNVQVTSTPS
jgi:Ca2+-binding RTX toxin-like protein